MKCRYKILRDCKEFLWRAPQSGRGQIGNRKVFARNGQSAVIISRSHPGIVTGRIPGRHKESAFQAQRIENDLPGNIFKSLMPDFLQKQLENTVSGVRIFKSSSLRLFRPCRPGIIGGFSIQEICQADFRITAAEPVERVFAVQDSGSMAQDRPDGRIAFTSVRREQFPLAQIPVDSVVNIDLLLLMQFHDADGSDELGDGTRREYGVLIHGNPVFPIGKPIVFRRFFSRGIRPCAANSGETFHDLLFHSGTLPEKRI